MYGDTDVMRRRTGQLREQGADLRRMADLLVAQTEDITWSGRAADAMRERIRARATGLRDAADRHDAAADALERHQVEVDALKDWIAGTERRATALVEDGLLDPVGLPPSGHKDWLTVGLPGH